MKKSFLQVHNTGKRTIEYSKGDFLKAGSFARLPEDVAKKLLNLYPEEVKNFQELAGEDFDNERKELDEAWEKLRAERETFEAEKAEFESQKVTAKEEKRSGRGRPIKAKEESDAEKENSEESII
jgi:uncharacterized membrane protein YukC